MRDYNQCRVDSVYPVDIVESRRPNHSQDGIFDDIVALREKTVFVVCCHTINRRSPDKSSGVEVAKYGNPLLRIAVDFNPVKNRVHRAAAGRLDENSVTTVVDDQGTRHSGYGETARTNANSAAGQVSDHGVLNGQRCARLERNTGLSDTTAVDEQTLEVYGVVRPGIDGDAGAA